MEENKDILLRNALNMIIQNIKDPRDLQVIADVALSIKEKEEENSQR